ncbi:hypothetical protein ACFYL6_20275, partial [Micromonospora sp. NPDC007208]|uniref:hypothetical protein n=1 Tax=Micromonospora sp. NPDC007208 TaxID=3364236 RepID=UPI0036BD7E50
MLTDKLSDGSVVTYDDDGHVTSQELPDGTVFSAFTDDGPTHVALPNGGVASISYAGGGSTWSFDDGSKVSYDSSSRVTSQVSSDGTVFSAFTDDGPTHVVLPNGGVASISYAGGGSTWSFDEGSTVSYDGSGHVTSQVSSDGTVFSAFDSESRPTQASVPGSGEVTISYAANGGSTWSFDDGSKVSYDGSGRVMSQVSDEGTVFSAFTDDGPTHAVLPNGGGVASISYVSGGSTWSFDDGSKVSYDSSSRVTSQVSDDGTVFSGFDSESRPTHASVPGSGEVTISYAANGGSTWSFDDGSKVSYDSSSRVTSQVSDDGTVFSGFDSESRPT